VNHAQGDISRRPDRQEVVAETKLVPEDQGEGRHDVVREGHGGQGPLAHDDGMDELNRNVLRIAGRCAGAERNQDTVAGEAARHPVAQVRKTVCIAMKEGMNNLGALGVGLLHQLRPVR
jgi:hypothetical protein